MAVAIVGTWVSGETHAEQGTDDTDRIGIVIVCNEGTGGSDGRPSAITWGGQTMTQQVVATAAEGNFTTRTEIWYMLETEVAAMSSSTISITWTSDNGRDLSLSAFYTGVDQTTPFVAQTTDTDTGNPTGLTGASIATVADGMAVQGIEGGTTNIDTTHTGGFTEQLDLNGTSIRASSGDRTTDGTNITPACTFASAQSRGSLAAVSLRAAAAASGRIMSSLVGAGGLAGQGGLAGSGGGLAA